MAITIVGQGTVGDQNSGSPTYRTVRINLAMKQGDIIILTSMPNMGNSYQSSTANVSGFTKLSVDVPSGHNIHMYFKTLDSNIDSLTTTFLSCYATTWMVIRGGVVESYSLTASFPLTLNYSDNKKRMVFLTGAYPGTTPWVKSQYDGYNSTYTTFYAEFINNISIPQHTQYVTPDKQKNYLVIKEGIANIAPTTPGAIQGITAPLYLTREQITISWAKSTDADGDAITYEVEYSSDGSTWSSLGTGITVTSYYVKIFNPAETGRLRVRAKDAKGNYSGYSYSPYFKIYKCLYVMQDGAKNKTFKNGVWSVI